MLLVVMIVQILIINTGAIYTERNFKNNDVPPVTNHLFLSTDSNSLT